MLASSGGRDEAQGELETRDGLDYPEIINLGDSSRSSAAGRTDTDDIDDGCSSVSLATSKILGTHSDSDWEFVPDLSAEFPSLVKATPEKNVVVDESINISDDGNSAETKIVHVSKEKSSTESTEASQPPVKPETPILDASFIKQGLFGCHTDSCLMQDEDSNLLTTYMSEKEFRDYGHVRSGKYFLPLPPNLTALAKRSGLLSRLIFISFADPCGATYKWCFPTVHMLRY